MKHLHSPIRYGFSIAEARLLRFATANPEAGDKNVEADVPKGGAAAEGVTSKALQEKLANNVQDLLNKLEASGPSDTKKSAVKDLRELLAPVGKDVEKLDKELQEIIEKAQDAIAKAEEDALMVRAAGPEEKSEKEANAKKLVDKCYAESKLAQDAYDVDVALGDSPEKSKKALVKALNKERKSIQDNLGSLSTTIVPGKQPDREVAMMRLTDIDAMLKTLGSAPEMTEKDTSINAMKAKISELQSAWEIAKAKIPDGAEKNAYDKTVRGTISKGNIMIKDFLLKDEKPDMAAYFNLVSNLISQLQKIEAKKEDPEALKKSLLEKIQSAHKTLDDEWKNPKLKKSETTQHIYDEFKKDVVLLKKNIGEDPSKVAAAVEVHCKSVVAFTEVLKKGPESTESVKNVEAARKSLQNAWTKNTDKMGKIFSQVTFEKLDGRCEKLLMDALLGDDIKVSAAELIKDIKAFVATLEKSDVPDSKKITAANKKLNDAWNKMTKDAAPSEKLKSQFDELVNRYMKFISEKTFTIKEGEKYIADVDAFVEKLIGGFDVKEIKDPGSMAKINGAEKKLTAVKKIIDELPGDFSGMKTTEVYESLLKECGDLRGEAAKSIITAKADDLVRRVNEFLAGLEAGEKEKGKDKEKEKETEKKIRECRERANKVAEKIRSFATQSDRDSRVADRMLANVEENLTLLGKEPAREKELLPKANEFIADAEKMYTTEEGWEKNKWKTLIEREENKWMALPGTIGKPGFVYKWKMEGGKKQVYAYSPALGAEFLQSMNIETNQWSFITDTKMRDEIIKTVPANSQMMVEKQEVQRIEVQYKTGKGEMKALISAMLPGKDIKDLIWDVQNNTATFRCIIDGKACAINIYLPGHPKGGPVEYPPAQEIADAIVYQYEKGVSSISAEDRLKLGYLRRSEGYMTTKSGSIAQHLFKLDGRKPYVDVDGTKRWIDTKNPVWGFTSKDKAQDLPWAKEEKPEKINLVAIAAELRTKYSADIRKAMFDGLTAEQRKTYTGTAVSIYVTGGSITISGTFDHRIDSKVYHHTVEIKDGKPVMDVAALAKDFLRRLNAEAPDKEETVPEMGERMKKLAAATEAKMNVLRAAVDAKPTTKEGWEKVVSALTEVADAVDTELPAIRMAIKKLKTSRAEELLTITLTKRLAKLNDDLIYRNATLRLADAALAKLKEKETPEKQAENLNKAWSNTISEAIQAKINSMKYAGVQCNASAKFFVEKGVIKLETTVTRGVVMADGTSPFVCGMKYPIEKPLDFDNDDVNKITNETFAEFKRKVSEKEKPEKEKAGAKLERLLKEAELGGLYGKILVTSTDLPPGKKTGILFGDGKKEIPDYHIHPDVSDAQMTDFVKEIKNNGAAWKEICEAMKKIGNLSLGSVKIHEDTRDNPKAVLPSMQRLAGVLPKINPGKYADIDTYSFMYGNGVIREKGVLTIGLDASEASIINAINGPEKEKKKFDKATFDTWNVNDHLKNALRMAGIEGEFNTLFAPSSPRFKFVKDTGATFQPDGTLVLTFRVNDTVKRINQIFYISLDLNDPNKALAEIRKDQKELIEEFDNEESFYKKWKGKSEELMKEGNEKPRISFSESLKKGVKKLVAADKNVTWPKESEAVVLNIKGKTWKLSSDIKMSNETVSNQLVLQLDSNKSCLKLFKVSDVLIGDTLDYKKIVEFSEDAIRFSESEDKGKDSLKNFELVEPGEKMAYICLWDMQDEPVFGNAGLSAYNFPKVLQEKYNVKGHTALANEDIHFVDGGINDGTSPYDKLRAKILQCHAKGIRNFYLPISAHGGENFVGFKNRQELRGEDLTKLQNEFDDCKLRFRVDSCYTGGIAKAIKNFKDKSTDKNGKEIQKGRVMVFNTGKDSATTVSSDGTMLYNAFLTHYLLVEKLSFGEAHRRADAKEKLITYRDAEVFISNPEAIPDYIAKDDKREEDKDSPRV